MILLDRIPVRNGLEQIEQQKRISQPHHYHMKKKKKFEGNLNRISNVRFKFGLTFQQSLFCIPYVAEFFWLIREWLLRRSSSIWHLFRRKGISRNLLIRCLVSSTLVSHLLNRICLQVIPLGFCDFFFSEIIFQRNKSVDAKIRVFLDYIG